MPRGSTRAGVGKRQLLKAELLSASAAAVGDFGAGFAAVDEEGDGAAVFHGDDHVGAEAAGLKGDAGVADHFDQLVEHELSELGIGGGAQAGSATAAGFAGDGEVADQEDAAVDLFDVEV